MIPPLERELDDDLSWLRALPAVAGSLGDAEAADSPPGREATAAGLSALVAGADDFLPRAFTAFIGDRELQRRVRSCTACYLDLAGSTVDAPGGLLIHFLSDQQWVLHWLLYVGDDGSESVVVTETPYGFDGEAPTRFDATPRDAVCAEAFNDFLYRFRIENEIWFARYERRALTSEEAAYAEAWRRIGSSSAS